MTVTLLLADSLDPARPARPVKLQVQVLQTSPGGEDVTVSFQPNRADGLYESAKSAAHLAYRILFREGIVRSQLVLRLQVDRAPANVVGRSADLAFALAILMRAYEASGSGTLLAARSFPPIAATGVLESDGTVRAVDHLASKLAAACDAFDRAPAIIFFPAESTAAVDLSTLSQQHPELRLQPIGHLDQALEGLGIDLERVYLRNPFRGLEYFDYEHRAIFFGRDAEIREVIEQLLRREETGAPGVLVEGASGSGKSSFVRAGLLPALANPSAQSSRVAEALRRRPVRDSVRNATWRLGHVVTSASEQLLAQSVLECWRTLPEFECKLPQTCTSLVVLADERQRFWPATQRFVWLIDQLEELLALGEDLAIDALGRFLLRLQAEGVWTLGCVRADALPLLKQHGTLREVFGANEGEYYLEPVSGTALDDVIVRPADAAGLTFGQSHSGKPLDQVLREELYATRENTLPLLQFTLHELYQRRSGTILRYEAYEQLGGLSGSVATAAEATLQSDPESERVLPRIIRGLVSVDDEGRPSKRYAPMAEIAIGDARRKVLDRLVQARLCVTDQHEGSAVVAFAHEALLRTWPRLRDWLIQESSLLQARDLLIAEARRWEQRSERRDWLVTAPDRLASVRSVIEADMPLPEVARRFAKQSANRARRATRIRQLAVSSIAAMAVIAVLFGVYAQHAGNVAAAQRDAAVQAQSQALTQAAAGMLTAGDVPTAQATILELLTGRHLSTGNAPAVINLFQEARAADTQILAITGHAGSVNSAAFSPDGHYVVTGSFDNTARVWDAATGRQIQVLHGHTEPVNSVAFSSDGSRVATGSADATARIWDVATGRQILLLRGHADRVQKVAFSLNDAKIATASDDKTARVWDASTGRQLALFSRHTAPVESVAFSPDGLRVVSASLDRTAWVWDAATGREITALRGHKSWVSGAAFSPDGQRVATASFDKTTRVWDAATGQQILVLNGHAAPVASVAFSGDGTHLLTASADKSARIWDATTGQQIRTLSGHTDLLTDAAYSSDGLRVVTASFDGTARIWDTTPNQQTGLLLGHTGWVLAAAFSRDGRRIATGSEDNTVRTWDVASGHQLMLLRGHTDRVTSVAFSPDDRLILTASSDKSARIWEAQTGKQRRVLAGHPDLVTAAAYSPDGTFIVTASGDTTARVWNAATGASVRILSGHTSRVTSAAFSPDGKQIVTASFDNTTRIWDAATGRQIRVLSGHTDRVTCASFSPDGREIVTASFDKTARLWDAATGRQIAMLAGHSGWVLHATFSPDNHYVLTASADNTSRLWDATNGQQLLLLAGHTDWVQKAGFSPDGGQIVTASLDNTARVWRARPPPLDTQIEWAEAAQFDELSTTQRTQLGLGPGEGLRDWSQASKCDELAAAPYDPDRRAPGVLLQEIVPDIAVPACDSKHAGDFEAGRTAFQYGRALLAQGDLQSARKALELAVSRRYRSAAVELAGLLLMPSAQMTDPSKAISLYRLAWQAGVPLAAFRLAELYEHGLRLGKDRAVYGVPPDTSQARYWYRLATDAGEPNALAWYADQRIEAAVSQDLAENRRRDLLDAFSYYAGATLRARGEGWPEAVWRGWRYRRASIARVLAREGMMEQVALSYAELHRERAPRPEPPTSPLSVAPTR